MIRFLICASALLGPAIANGWYGPICYSSATKQVVLTLPSIAGETPGDVRVDYDDNDGRIERHEIRASKTVARAHEVALIRGPESAKGVVGVIVTSLRSTTGYKFELDFQRDPAECSGAIVKATDQPLPRLAAAPKRKAAVVPVAAVAAVQPAQPEAPARPETQPQPEAPARPETQPQPEAQAATHEPVNPVPAELPDVEAPSGDDAVSHAASFPQGRQSVDAER